MRKFVNYMGGILGLAFAVVMIVALILGAYVVANILLGLVVWSGVV